MQAKVKGAHLFDFRVQELKVNPCMDEKQSFCSLVLYYLRKKVYIIYQSSSKPLRIGGLVERYRKPWYLRTVDYLTRMVAN